MSQLSKHQQENFDVCGGALHRTRYAQTQGHAGVGKTFSMRKVIEGGDECVSLPNFTEIIGFAPTWAAAKQATLSTGINFISGHSLLYSSPDEDKQGKLRFGAPHSDNIPYGSLVLADESGFHGTKMGEDIVAMCEEKNAYLWCWGDNFQLGPVNGERYFDDSKTNFTLTEVVRQNPGPGLRMLQHMRSQSRMHYGSMERFADQKELVACGYMRDKLLRRFLEKFGDDGQVIVHRNKSRHEINWKSRQILGRNRVLNVGERLVFLSNVEPVVNSDVGIVASWEPAGPGKWTAINRISYLDMRFTRVTLKDGRQVVISQTCLERGDAYYNHLNKEIAKVGRNNKGYMYALKKAMRSFAKCDYAYAITGHKSQGSQYPNVLALLEYDQINWLYTVCSRYMERLMFAAPE